MYTTLVWQSQTGQNKYTKPLYSLEGLTVPSAKRLNKIQRNWPWDFFLPILSSTNSLTINFIVPYQVQSWTGHYLMCGPMWLVLAVIIGSPESMPSYRKNPGLTSRYISMCLLAIIQGPSKNSYQVHVYLLDYRGLDIFCERSQLSSFAMLFPYYWVPTYISYDNIMCHHKKALWSERCDNETTITWQQRFHLFFQQFAR